MVASVVAVVVAYLIGSLSFAVIVSRAMGLADPHSYGSGNPGATNVLRSGSKRAAALTLLLDAFKGWLPVAVVAIFGARWGLGVGTEACVGLAAFAGHLFPLYFGFKGGKGVATSAGVTIAFAPWLGLIIIVLWIVVAAATRYSSLAAVVASIATPVLYALASGHLWPFAWPLFWALVVIVLALLWRHHENIARLLAGKESRIGHKNS